jgi:lysozyme family protein
MASANYPACLNFTFKYEGGYVNHPRDPGGPTNFGITQAVLAGWRRHPVSAEDVKNMPRHEAGEIYRANYWKAMRGDDLPAGVDLVVWDYGVNSGPTRAIKALQGALGIKADGFIGAATIEKAREAEPDQLVQAICDQRRKLIRNLSTYSTFGKGWEARISACRRLGISMTRHQSGSLPAAIMPDPNPIEETPAKARGSDEKLINAPIIRAGGGAAAAGTAIAVKEGVEVAREVVDTGKSAGEIATSIGPWLLLALVVVGFAVYIIWRRRAQIQGNEE